jgi:ribosomal protein L37E
MCRRSLLAKTKTKTKTMILTATTYTVCRTCGHHLFNVEASGASGIHFKIIRKAYCSNCGEEIENSVWTSIKYLPKKTTIKGREG